MPIQKEKYQIAAWKTYTQWGPEGTGYWLDDLIYGIPFIEKARSLGIKVICIHKGLPLFRLKPEYGPAATSAPLPGVIRTSRSSFTIPATSRSAPKAPTTRFGLPAASTR